MEHKYHWQSSRLFLILWVLGEYSLHTIASKKIMTCWSYNLRFSVIESLDDLLSNQHFDKDIPSGVVACLPLSKVTVYNCK